MEYVPRMSLPCIVQMAFLQPALEHLRHSAFVVQAPTTSFPATPLVEVQQEVEDTPLAKRPPEVTLARLNTFDGWTSEVAWENRYAMRSPLFPSDRPHSLVSIHLQSDNQIILSERIPQHAIPGAPLRVCTLQVRPCVYNPD